MLLEKDEKPKPKLKVLVNKQTNEKRQCKTKMAKNTKK
jgi:hypothetical protein